MLQAAPGGGQKVRITLRACGITAKSTSWAMVLESAWGEQGQPWAEVPEQLGELRKQSCLRMSQAELRSVRGHFLKEETPAGGGTTDLCSEPTHLPGGGVEELFLHQAPSKGICLGLTLQLPSLLSVRFDHQKQIAAPAPHRVCGGVHSAGNAV